MEYGQERGKLGLCQWSYARERRTCTDVALQSDDLSINCKCVLCRADFLDLDMVCIAVQRGYVEMRVSVSIDPRSCRVDAKYPARIVRKDRRDNQPVIGSFHRLKTPLGPPRSVPMTGQSSVGGRTDGSIPWHRGGRSSNKKRGQTRLVRFSEQGKTKQPAPQRQGFKGRFECDPEYIGANGRRGGYRAPGRRRGRLDMVHEDLVKSVQSILEERPLPPAVVAEERRAAEVQLTQAMREQDGVALQVDLDGVIAPRDKRNTREVASAMGKWVSYGSGLKDNQTMERKKSLQSLVQVNDNGQGYSARHVPEHCEEWFYVEKAWFCDKIQ